MSYGGSDVSDEEFRAKLNELVHKTQVLLHDNWQSIESEAQNGAYAPRLGAETQEPE